MKGMHPIPCTSLFLPSPLLSVGRLLPLSGEATAFISKHQVVFDLEIAAQLVCSAGGRRGGTCRWLRWLIEGLCCWSVARPFIGCLRLLGGLGEQDGGTFSLSFTSCLSPSVSFCLFFVCPSLSFENLKNR